MKKKRHFQSNLPGAEPLVKGILCHNSHGPRRLVIQPRYAHARHRLLQPRRDIHALLVLDGTCTSDRAPSESLLKLLCLSLQGRRQRRFLLHSVVVVNLHELHARHLLQDAVEHVAAEPDICILCCIRTSEAIEHIIGRITVDPHLDRAETRAVSQAQCGQHVVTSRWLVPSRPEQELDAVDCLTILHGQALNQGLLRVEELAVIGMREETDGLSVEDGVGFVVDTARDQKEGEAGQNDAIIERIWCL